MRIKIRIKITRRGGARERADQEQEQEEGGWTRKPVNTVDFIGDF
jgi:hypothetical protein